MTRVLGLEPPSPSRPSGPLTPTRSLRRRTSSAKAPFEASAEEDDDMLEADMSLVTALAASQEVEDDGPLQRMESLNLDDGLDLPVLHLEVRLVPTTTIRFDHVRRAMHLFLRAQYADFLTHSELPREGWGDASWAEHVERVWVGEHSGSSDQERVSLREVELALHVYQPFQSTSFSALSPLASSSAGGSAASHASDDESEADSSRVNRRRGKGKEDPGLAAATMLQLPNKALEGLWDSLVYEEDIKGTLLNYIYSTVFFSDAGVDYNIVSWNRVVLLHGPPGTGKTSLCRALAQKLSIRLSDRYEHGRLISINSHSLFSKWFSESGKLVQRLFGAVEELVEDETGFVVVLIDEVESLTAARAGAMSGKEPSDALRVVNALLTQLDNLKTRKNCLVVTTSNLSEAIDDAFVDRADIKCYVGLPPVRAVYWILAGCLQELMEKGMIAKSELLDHPSTEIHLACAPTSPSAEIASSLALHVLSVAAHDAKLSGRSLRRLPVMAHARYLAASGKRKLGVGRWIEAMGKCVLEETRQIGMVERGGSGLRER